MMAEADVQTLKCPRCGNTNFRTQSGSFIRFGIWGALVTFLLTLFIGFFFTTAPVPTLSILTGVILAIGIAGWLATQNRFICRNCGKNFKATV